MRSKAAIMNRANLMKNFLLPVSMVALFLTAILFRPLLSIDETRYMTIAWEMFWQKSWLEPLTMNFEPYHHKPPLLFWTINLSWELLGVGRVSGLVPIAFFSLICLYLTSALGRLTLSGSVDGWRIRLIMAGSIPFMVYATLVMFDLALCVFVLLSLICLLYFRKNHQGRYISLLGLCLGLGALTKGSVIYLYVLPVALLAPFWVQNFSHPLRWYGGIGLAVILSILLVLCWLIPILNASETGFAYELLWKQSFGRIAGNFGTSHARPFWFYLPLLPVVFMPWLFCKEFWRGLRVSRLVIKEHEGLRFLLFWLLPTFLAFCLVSGKQPHYLVPLMPGVALMVAYFLQKLPNREIIKTFVIALIIFIGAQMVASQTFFKRYGLDDIAAVIATQPERDLAFVGSNNGELGFLVRRQSAVDIIWIDQIEQWFEEHPSGWVVSSFIEGEKEIEIYKMIFAQPYRGRNLGIFEK